MWQDLLVGVSLVLVIEGIMPFLSPGRFRRTLLLASQLDDNAVRTIGLISMVVGLVVLYTVR